MSTTTATDYTADPLAAALALLGRVRPEHRATWGDTLPTERRGTVRAWMAERHGRRVDLLQVTAHADGRLTSGWAPGPRTVDASAAGRVELDGSRRDYAGCRVVAVDAARLVAVAPWGDDAVQVMIYRDAD